MAALATPRRTGQSSAGRHPDCPLGPSLVVSRIALTVWGPTYRYRSEQFAATILSRFLATAIFDDRDVGVHGADQLSRADDYFGRYLPFADQHCELCKLDSRRQSAGVPHHIRGNNLIQQSQPGYYAFPGRLHRAARDQSIYQHE